MRKVHYYLLVILVILGTGIIGYYFVFSYFKNASTANDIQNSNVSGATAENSNSSGNSAESENANTNTTMMRTSGICFEFIFNKNFVALPTNNYRMPRNIEPLKLLAQNWNYGTICPNLDTTNIFIVLVSKDATNIQSTQNTLLQTRKLYPKLSPDSISPDEQSLYQMYLYADIKTELRNGSSVLTLDTGELREIGSIVWNQALAACWINTENIVSDSGVTVQCGMGDNGCSNYERVRWDIFSTKKTYLGMCRHNCDLAPNESFVVNCQK